VNGCSKVDFYNKRGIRWIKVTNETGKSLMAVKAISQALALTVESAHPQRLWAYEASP
jgi:hypothetical protein